MINKKSLFLFYFFFFSINILFAQNKSILEERFLSIQAIDYKENNKILALKKYKELVINAPYYSRTYLPLVRTFIEQNKRKEAYTFFNNLLKTDSTNGYVYYCLSRLNSDQEKYKKAIDQLQKCILLIPKYAQAYGYNYGLGRIYQIIGDDANALKYYEKAISTPSDAKGVFYLSFNEIIKIYSRRQDIIKLNKYLELLKEAANIEKDSYFRAWALSTLGHYQFYFGQYRDALSYLFKAIVDTKDPQILSCAYGNMGAIYYYLGEMKKCFYYLKKQLWISNENDLYELSHIASNNIGFILIDKKEYNKSLRHFKQLLKKTEDFKNDWYKLKPLQGVADSYFKLKDYYNAWIYYIRAYKKSTKLSETHFNADIQLSLGNFFIETGNYNLALKYLNNSAKICDKVGLLLLKWRVEISQGLAYYELGEVEKAINSFTKSLISFEKEKQHIRNGILGNSFFNERYLAYYYLIKLLSEQRRYIEAFEVIEKYKSNSIQSTKLLGESSYNSFRKSKKIKNINNKIEKLHLNISELNKKNSIRKKEIYELQEKVAILELKKSYHLDSLNIKTKHSLIELNDLQNNILNDYTTLIHFIVGDESISVFAIKKDSILYKELYISHDELANLLNNISAMYRLQKSDKLDFNTNVLNAVMANFSISYLYEAYEILIKPLTSFIENSNKLIIVPDDLLYYVPFDALISDTTLITNSKDFTNVKFLIQDYDISYASSASALNMQSHNKNLEAKYDLLAFGNPDYTSLQIKDTLAISSSSYNRGMKNLHALPFAQTEVHLIGEIVGPFFSKVFTKLHATEDNFKAFAENTRILHFATHFMTNDEDPLYSKIALARNNISKEDGLLQPFEISNMQLNANLAVLSACNTALGKVSKGQGIVGISRAFISAGVPSLVVSQWNVDDQSTSIIMTSFYRYLKKGLSKSKALYAAKLDFLNSVENKYKDPFYWAPFILIGNPEPIEFHKTYYKYLWVIIFTISFILYGIWARKKIGWLR